MTVLSPAQVLGYYQKYGSGEGHNWSSAQLLAAGLSPTEITKFFNATRGGANTTASGWLADGELMTQIAWYESKFDTNAHNPKPPDNSYGLWQINMLGALGPSRRAQFHLDKNEDLFDPVTNARVAHTFVNSPANLPGLTGGNVAFHPWTGSYQKALKDIANGTARLSSGSVPEDSAVPGVGSTDTQIPDLRGLISGIGGFLSTITDPTWWKRIGIGALGIAIVVGGIVLWNKEGIQEVAVEGGKAMK